MKKKSFFKKANKPKYCNIIFFVFAKMGSVPPVHQKVKLVLSCFEIVTNKSLEDLFNKLKDDLLKKVNEKISEQNTKI